jgi:hypothetical protein
MVDDVHVRSRLRVSHRGMDVQVAKVLDGLQLFLDSYILEVLVAENDDSTLSRKQRKVVESL